MRYRFSYLFLTWLSFALVLSAVIAAHTEIETGVPGDGHWSYGELVSPEPPTPRDSRWCRNEIDQFVLSRLEHAGREPSAAADRYTLIKRLYYDLVGLPPDLETVDTFVASDSVDAYEQLADDLLRSPHFGERWGRHWLDKARYADSDGYEADKARPNAWRYRDWVIDAINQDMPYDQFSIKQLAGDLLGQATPLDRLATAFHRQTHTNNEGGVDQEEFRVKAVVDRVNTTGAVWLGLTLGCAQCHDHKYDQIAQREYYELFAFFNNADETDADVRVNQFLSEEKACQLESQTVRLEQQVEERRSELLSELPVLEQQLIERVSSDDPDAKPETVPDPIRQILDISVDERNPQQQQQLADYFVSLDPSSVQLRDKITEVIRDLDEAWGRGETMSSPVIAQRDEPRKTHLLHRGDFLQPGEEVVCDTLGVFPALSKDQPNRLDLAQWLFDEANPLVPRVAVNHLWAKLFGHGLVRTMNDFGVRGEPPTHPDLLDWLAVKYKELGWSRKALIKTIVMSSTYRQSSRIPNQDPLDTDLPGNPLSNRLLGRQNRFRVDAEIVRDLYLSASGLLSAKIGGPSVFPPLPVGIAELSFGNSFSWETSSGEDRYRRGMYTFFKRTSPHPNLLTFDCPDANTTNVQRPQSNTPLAALATLNNKVFVEAAQVMASRVLSFRLDDDSARMARAVRICIARPPTDDELNDLVALLDQSRSWYAENTIEAEQIVGQHRPDGVPVAEAAAWVTAARVVLNLDEFITRE
jgi:hypothetical protein